MSTTLTSSKAPRNDEVVGGSALSIRNLNKTFHRKEGGEVPAIDNTSMEVARGEFLVLLGSSGCGKSTFLRSIAGLERPDSGVIDSHGQLWYSSDDKVVVPPERRDLSMIFQSYALWPHMTIHDNVAYPLTTGRHKLSRSAMAEQVRSVLELVGIEELAQQYPAQISGGQQQRVALARALVRNSEIVLFDEPLSNVDARVRDQLRTEIRSMQQRLGFTALYVTHDQEEALAIADRIAVIDKGRVAHLASPREVYLEPANLRVARFVGKLNEAEGVVLSTRDDGTLTVRTESGDVVAGSAEDGLVPGDTCVVVWRPERIRLGWPTPGGVNVFEGTVNSSSFLGYFTDTQLASGSRSFLWRNIGDKPVPVGDKIIMTVSPEDVRALKPMG